MDFVQIPGVSSIDIRGARGTHALSINGIYEPTEEICNGWVVYRKKGDPNKWMEFFLSANNWYIKTTSDKGKPRGWLRLHCEPPTFPELSKATCEVWDGSKWTTQSSISIMTLKQRREEDKRIGTERRLQAVPVDIRGSRGPSAASINGVYIPTNEICGGWPVYRKEGDSDKWLEFIVSTSEWYVKPTADRGRAEGWMCLSADPPNRPELCKGICEVWDGERWTVQNSVTVLTAVSAFETLMDTQIFCYDEMKELHSKLCSTLSRSVSMLNISKDKVAEGNKQMEAITNDIHSKLSALRAEKEKKVIKAEANMGLPDKPFSNGKSH